MLQPFTTALPSLSVISSERGGTTIVPFSSVFAVYDLSAISFTVTLTSATGLPIESRTVTVMRFA